MATIAEDIRIQPGTPDQIDSVMAVMEAAFGDTFGEAWTRSQLSGILPMAGVSLNLAVDRESSAILGFSLVRTVADESELLLVAVLPRVQRRGVGGALLDHFIERAREDSVRRVHLEVRDGNPAIDMYLAAGFSPVGRRRNYYHAPSGKRFDAITLASSL
jgi:ribosomal-protein-alanine N-acetyltransferase